MKRVVPIFLVLLIAFCFVWVIKPKSIINNDVILTDNSGAWWLSGDGKKISVDKEWILDPEIPENYVPVPDEDELYMVIDDDGAILQFRKRVLQDDGSWVWTTVQEHSQLTPTDIENVFEVTSNNTTEYLKYIRNKDNTYAFEKSDANGNIIGYDVPYGPSIPDNYIKVDDNTYAVTNKYGVIIEYKNRYVDSDGNNTWKKTDNTGKIPMVQTGSTTSSTIDKPVSTTSSLPQWTLPATSSTTKATFTTPNETKLPVTSTTTKSENSSSTPKPVENDTYTETETTTLVEVDGGYEIKYQIKIIKTYSADGTLISTKRENPVEISRKKIVPNVNETPDKNKIEKSLVNEYIRMTSSIEYEDETAEKLFALLNNQRKTNGVGTLSMNKNSDAYMLARIFAADMVLYNHADETSPLYGSLNDLIAKYSNNIQYSSSNIWKCSSKTAEQINTRFQTLENSKNIRMNNVFTDVGIAIVEKDGYLYIIELFIG